MRKLLIKILESIPYFGKIYCDYKLYKTYYPPGHFANPFPSLEDVEKYSDKLFNKDEKFIPGINLNSKKQEDLLFSFKDKYAEIPYHNPSKNYRYSYENQMFGYGDGVFLWLMITHFKPQNIIEVGSGFSSALMLDVNDYVMNNSMSLTFIDPYTEKLYSNLRIGDNSKATILEKPIQDVALDTFKFLAENDILFLDTSHIFKTASDLNYEFFEVLPSLNKGVLIHLHDVFYPFEYPKEWVLKQKAYNEIYLIRAFLMYNDSFEIVIFPNYLMQKNEDWFKQNMPNCLKNRGGSIWFRKIK